MPCKESRNATRKKEFLIAGINDAIQLLILRDKQRKKLDLREIKGWAGKVSLMLQTARKGIRQVGNKNALPPPDLDAEEDV